MTLFRPGCLLVLRAAVTARLTAAGLWVVSLVHLRRAPAGDPEADGESFWTDTTFGVK